MSTTRVRRLLLCVCGGYQAHTVPAFIVQLLRHFADDVQVVLSRAATSLVARDAVEVASRNPVFVDMNDRAVGVYLPHIELPAGADLVLVCPATVNLVGKLANGIADDLISALLLASEKPVVIVPVSNDAMIRHPATQRNIATLRADGYLVMDPPKAMEIADRGAIDERVGPFPYPELLMYLSAAAAGKHAAVPARRKPA